MLLTPQIHEYITSSQVKLSPKFFYPQAPIGIDRRWGVIGGVTEQRWLRVGGGLTFVL